MNNSSGNFKPGNNKPLLLYFINLLNSVQYNCAQSYNYMEIITN